MVFVEDDGGPETSGGINAGSGDGDGDQMNQEDSESDGERSQNLHSSKREL